MQCTHVFNYAFLYFIAGRAFTNAFFGAGTGPIYLDEVQCRSSSSQLLECSSRPIGSHDCLHTADAGVGCEGMYYIQVYTFFLFEIFHCTQLLVQLVNCDWQMVTFQMRAEWRSV